MEIKEIRYKNTNLLVAECGGVSEFADRLGKSQSQVSSFAGSNPIKGIGHKIAREIERCFGKPTGWLDSIHSEMKIDEKSRIKLKIDSLTPAELLSLEGYIDGLSARKSTEQQ